MLLASYIADNAWLLKCLTMDEEFTMWDCSWFWDNSFADLSPVGNNGQLNIPLNIAGNYICVINTT